jgi:hypothetical protein
MDMLRLIGLVLCGLALVNQLNLHRYGEAAGAVAIAVMILFGWFRSLMRAAEAEERESRRRVVEDAQYQDAIRRYPPP